MFILKTYLHDVCMGTTLEVFVLLKSKLKEITITLIVKVNLLL